MGSGKKRKGQRKKEDSNVNANAIPESSREIVQNMKEVVNCCEQEIYAMLVECNLDADEAITRLLSQDSFQDVKSKRDQKKEAKEKSRKCERGKDSNVNADIVKCSEQETSATKLVKCNKDADKAVNRLLSQDGIQQVKSNQDEKKETKDTLDSQSVGSSNQNRELSDGGDNYVDQGGGNKFQSDERNNVKGIRYHLAGSSTAAGILGPSFNSDVLNAEIKRAPTSSSEAVPSLSVPASRLISASGHRTMADVVKMGIATSKESVSKGPVKDDCHLPERPDESAATRDESASVSNQNLHDNFSYFSNSLFEFDARRNQLRGSALVSNQNLWDNSVTHPLSTSYDAKREEEFLKFTPDFILKVHIDDVACPLSNSFIEAATREDQLQESSSLSNQNLHDSSAKDPSASVDTNLQQLSIENDMPKTSVKELQHVQCGSFGSGMNGSAQPSSLPSGFLNYDDSEDISGSVVSPLSLQMQNINTIPTMRQQAYTKEPDPQASPLNQSMPTTSSLVLRLSVSMTETLLNASISEPQMNQQAMDHHQSQPMVPSGNDGDMMNYPYSQPTQNDTYNMSAFQKNGGHNNNSDTAANSMCGYEDVLSSEFSNQMATLHHQNGTSNMWTPQGLNDSGNDYYSLFSGPQKQQSESFRHSQQQQGQEQEQPCEDESSRYYASPDQGNK